MSLSISSNACALVVLVATSLPAVYAQSLPDAGSVQQQIERDRKPLLPRKATPERAAEPAALTPPSGLIVNVKAFRFAGNSLIGSEKLAGVVATYRNRPLDFTQLQAAAAAVATAYREAGWIVRAYLPAQDIVDNIITIQIVEAVFGGVKLEGTQAQRIKTAQLLDLFAAQQKTGEALNADALDRALLLADDLPGVAVSGSLQQGAQERETNLVVKLADEALLLGDVALDNTGSGSTGSERLAANLNVNSPFGFGDLLSGNALHTQGSNYLRLGYTAPLGAYGWRVGANASVLNYKLITSEFAALDGKGSSSTTGIELSYPVIRSRLKNLYFSANADRKSYDNQSNGASSTLYKTDSLSLGLSGNLFDNLGGGGANSASLVFSSGQLQLDGSPNQAADAASTQADGHYNKLRYAASRQQVLTDALSLFAAVSGQWASKNLDSSEKFYLGGASGVRAYPSSEAGGALGQLLSIELRWRLLQGFNVTGFFDAGQVSVNANNSFAGAPVLNDYSLKGAGLALAWQSSVGLNLKATWARRIGDNPNPTSTGNDQDGSLVKDRVWLTASVAF